MERKINKKIDESFTNYKQDIKTGIVGVITSINCKIDEGDVSDISLKQTIQTEYKNYTINLY